MKNRGATEECRRRQLLNGADPTSVTIDGFTVAEIAELLVESLIPARCSACGEIARVEPDAEGYDCANCCGEGTVTSPLIKLGLV